MAFLGGNTELKMDDTITPTVLDEHGEVDVNQVKKLEMLLHEAELGTAAEHRMSLWQALKLYPKASAWSIAISFAVVMEGEAFPL
jgi:hypothetical protein